MECQEYKTVKVRHKKFGTALRTMGKKGWILVLKEEVAYRKRVPNVFCYSGSIDETHHYYSLLFRRLTK